MGGKAEASAPRLEEAPPRTGEGRPTARPAQEAQNHHGGTGRGVPGQRLLNMKNSRHGSILWTGGGPKILILKNDIEEENPRERGKAGQAATALLL